jgi:hypothetical protein
LLLCSNKKGGEKNEWLKAATIKDYIKIVENKKFSLKSKQKKLSQ